MKYSKVVAAFVLAAAGSACADGALNPTEAAPAGPMASVAYSGVDAPARSHDEGGQWQEMSADSLWAVIAKSGGVAHVGLKSPGLRRGFYKGNRLLSAHSETQGAAAVAAIAGLRIVRRDQNMPVLRVELDDVAALEKIRRLPFVDYVEPALLPQEEGFEEALTSLMDSGCAYPDWGSGALYTLNGETLAQRFGLMQIENAWKRSRGRGVVVGVADSGLDYYQPEMMQSFSSGQSSYRTLKAHSVLPAATPGLPAWDGPCSHGPRMASLITAPRNGSSTVGVAHESDLVGVRFTDGVIDVDAWNAGEALNYIARENTNLGPRRVVPMAWRSAPSGYLSDLIDARHAEGILFVGAVGQSTCLNPFRGVAWPARKDNVVAVAGVEDNNELPCIMHRGPETDMAALMDFPVPGEMYGMAEIKWSSSSTAVVAGVAALIWSRYPAWTRDQVVARMHQSGLHYPARDERRGYGIINAYRAVGGFEAASVSAPSSVWEGTTFTATAQTKGEGPFTYLWSNGATTRTTSYTAWNSTYIWVQVTDQVEGLTRTGSTTVAAVPSTTCDPNVDPMCAV